MKPDSWLWMAVKGGAFVAVLATGAFFLKRLVEQTENSNQQEIDTWVEEKLVAALSKKLNLPSSQILTALQQPSSELNNEIQQIVESIDLLFSKISSSQIVLKLSLAYSDETLFSTTIEKSWDDLPEIVRKDFIQTGSQSVRVPWDFPVS
jgi:hypothetical protein